MRYTRCMAERVEQHDSLTVEEYLKLEESATVRHEYVGGEIFAMVGATKRHNRIIVNITGRLWGAARGGDCRVYSESVKLRVADDVIYYPDVMVACGPEGDDPLVEDASLSGGRGSLTKHRDDGPAREARGLQAHARPRGVPDRLPGPEMGRAPPPRRGRHLAPGRSRRRRPFLCPLSRDKLIPLRDLRGFGVRLRHGISKNPETCNLKPDTSLPTPLQLAGPLGVALAEVEDPDTERHEDDAHDQ